VASMQQRDGGGGLRAKTAWRDIRGPLCSDQVTTYGAADRMILMRGDLGPHDRELPHVLDAHGTSIWQAGVQRFEAGRTAVGMMVLYSIDLVGRRLRTVVALVARLA